MRRFRASREKAPKQLKRHEFWVLRERGRRSRSTSSERNGKRIFKGWKAVRENAGQTSLHTGSQAGGGGSGVTSGIWRAAAEHLGRTDSKRGHGLFILGQRFKHGMIG